MPSNQDAHPDNAGLKKVRTGFHVAGYLARTLGNKITGGIIGKLGQKASDAIKGYTRISSDSLSTFDVGGQQVQLPSKFMGDKLPPGKTLQTLQNEVQDKITAGERLLHQIENNHAPQQCSLKDMTDLMTFLQARAQAQHGNFSEGALSIPDPNNRIKNFLDTCPEAYQRKSSHISEFQNQNGGVGTHRGIDAYGRTRNPDEMLPHNMKTVMYGSLTQDPNMKMAEARLWMKMEPHGAWAFSPQVRDPHGPQRSANAHDGKAAVGHSLSFLETRGQGSKGGTRKERIPDDIKDAWKQLQKVARNNLVNNPPSNEIAAMLREGEGLQTARGIRFINSYLETMKASGDLSPDVQAQARFMQNVIKDRFPHDTLNARIGNEVILKDTDLRPRALNDIQDIPHQQQGNQVGNVVHQRNSIN